MSKDKVLNLSRRDFLKISSTTGAGLLVSIYLSACQDAEILPTGTPSPASTKPDLPSPTETTEPLPKSPPDFELQPNVYIKIDTNGMVTITVNKPEIGQGTRTSLPMIIAEELEVDWENVRLVQAQADNDYIDQNVGGSRSISGMYLPMRRAGAAVRGLLIAAAAEIWEVDPESCFARGGVVYHEPSGNQLLYGELLTKAAEIESSKSELKDIEEFRLIGSSFGRKDNAAIIDGKAEYASDLLVPDMLYAVVMRPPQQRNRMESYDDSKTLAVPGVRYVVPIDDGVAVVAENTWQAIKGREVLEVQWREVGNVITFSAPDDQHGSQNDGSTLTSSYTIPHFAHMPMEPMACMANVGENATIVWAPTQSPIEAKKVARSVVSGMPSEEYVEVNIPLVGGGFGRRIEVDYVRGAVQLSQAVNAPVKVFWTRQDDIRNDYLHPSGTVTVWASLSAPQIPQLRRTSHQSLVKTGAWRAVENNDNAFARESFMDEYAEALGMDPVKLRSQVYPESRLVDVMEKAIAESKWGGELPEGRALGLACFSTWNVTHVAEVAEVSIENDKIRVHKIVCAVDCGLVINPNIVKEQMEGGIVFALSAALGNEITIREGMIEQRNFSDFPILRFDEMPEIEVHIIPSTRSPQGVGEMSGPPVFAAVANALYALTGKRFRKLPFRL